MVSCCLNVDILLPLSDSRAGMENMEACLKVNTQTHMEKSVSKNGIETARRGMCFFGFFFFFSGGTKSVGAPDSRGILFV